MVTYVSGDLLKIDADIIAQQVNGRGVMGAGLALALRKQYPCLYPKYREFVQTWRGDTLARCQIVQVAPGKMVANLFGQDGIRRNLQDTTRYTDYAALKESLLRLFRTMHVMHFKTLAIPYGLGCGLAGGDWGVVSGIIEDAASQYPDVTCLIVNNKAA